MKFTCEDPSAAIKSVLSVVKKHHSPVLAGVRIEAKDNMVTFTCTDAQTWATATVDAAVSVGGGCVVSAKDLSVACVGMCDFEISGDALKLKSVGRFAFPLIDGAFPDSPTVFNEVEIEGGLDSIRSLSKFTDTSASSPMLHGVGFLGGYGTAYDGRVFMAKSATGGSGQIVHADAYLVAPKSGGRLFIGDGAWRIEAARFSAVGLMMEGSCLDFSRINHDGDVIASFDADRALSAARLACLGRANEVVISFGACGGKIQPDKFDGAHVDAPTSFDCDGIDATIVMKSKQFDRVMAEFSGSVVEFRCDGRSVKFSPAGGSGFALIGMIADARNSIPGQ